MRQKITIASDKNKHFLDTVRFYLSKASSLGAPSSLHGSRGFTIVELLIVIVVIAILAAITIVSYGGIQQRARNAAIIDSVSKTLKAIAAYTALDDSYPYTGSGTYLCVTTDSGCDRGGTAIGSNSTFDTNMANIGTLPRSVSVVSSARNGIIYQYTSTRVVDGVARPSILLYYLYGPTTNCGLPALTSDGTTASTSSSGYTTSNIGGSGTTYCVVSIPGPSF